MRRFILPFIFLFFCTIAPCAYRGPVGELADRQIAKVGNTAITLSELQEAVVERRLADPQSDSVPQRQLFEEELTRLIDDELIYQAAEQNKIKAPEEMVAARVKEITDSLEKSIGSQPKLEAWLAEQNLTLDKLKQLIARREEKQIAIMRAVSSRFTMTEADVKQFESTLKASNEPTGGYYLHHILIKCDPNADAATAKSAKERAFQAALAAQTKMTFEEAARQYSEDDSTRESGGNLGYVPEGAMMPELEQAVKAMKPGQISQPVRSATGFHVFLLENNRTPRKILYAKKFEEARLAMLAELRRTRNIETQMDFLKDIPEKTPASQPETAIR